MDNLWMIYGFLQNYVATNGFACQALIAFMAFGAFIAFMAFGAFIAWQRNGWIS